MTALHELKGLAEALGLSGFMVKDESTRFGLNAFKGLGGTYCVASCLADLMGLQDAWKFEDLSRENIQRPVFATATDGNHGRGIAYAARLFGCECHVFLPKGSAPERVENIRKEGAYAVVTQGDYDETVQICSGLRPKYTPEDMVGKKVMVIVNLAPRKMAGLESQGMILCAEDAEGNLSLMTPEKSEFPAGSEIC